MAPQWPEKQMDHPSHLTTRESSGGDKRGSQCAFEGQVLGELGRGESAGWDPRDPRSDLPWGPMAPVGRTSLF